VKPPAAACCCAGASADSPPSVEVLCEADLLRLAAVADSEGADGQMLLDLLDERHPVYDGVGTPAVVRMRGALLLALGRRTLPTSALPFVVEELETPQEAWLTAVAARVLRRYPEPAADFLEPLLAALVGIRQRDDVVRFDTAGDEGGEGEVTTAVAEVLRTIGWLGRAGEPALPLLRQLRVRALDPLDAVRLDEAITAIERAERPLAAACCCVDNRLDDALGVAPAEVSGLAMQDQDGELLTFGDFFVGLPSIVVFFYTRCDNPRKCPATIAGLGRLQRRLKEEGLSASMRTAAITYDPAYDLPHRLRQYGQEWGVTFDDNHRLLRTIGDFALLRAFFGLGVNYGSSGVVNRHQVEAFVLDPAGKIVRTSARRRWNELDLLAAARAVPRT
jgi:cytochrome oxidase Cu insertion factor (SCO1/SenC/PrrC family)